MSQSVTATSPTMHDIPLSAGADAQGDSANETHKTGNSKANSLKRFFKLPHRRHSAGEELPTGSNEAAPEDGGEEKEAVTDNDNEKEDEIEKPKKDHSKRFHLRLGGVNRIVEQADRGSFMGAQSRHSLKNSITGYWHTVFKRAGKKAAKQKDTEQNGDEEGVDGEEETNVTELREEVQTLSISEDTVEQVIQALE